MLGPGGGKLIGGIAKHVSSQINENPERTVGIVICPLFPARNEMSDKDNIDEQVHSVE